jgi:CheY-like chemotaxis protein
LAEDNRVNQVVATRLLEKRGLRDRRGGNGQAGTEDIWNGGLRHYFDGRADAGMDGLEAASAIWQREKNQGGHIPIIAMTAHAMVGDKERCLAARMDAYISKPLQIKDLFAVIEQLTPEVPTPADLSTR